MPPTLLAWPNVDQEPEHFDRFAEIEAVVVGAEERSEYGGDRICGHLVALRVIYNRLQMVQQE